MHGLATPLKDVVGTKTSQALAKSFNLVTVEDLLRHFPRRYADRGELTEMSSLKVDEHVTIMADVYSVTRRPMRQKRGSLLEVLVSDGTGTMKLTFFNQDWRERDLKVGRRGLFSGKVTVFRNERQLAHPMYVLVPSDTEPDPEAVAAFAKPLIPVYPATSTLPSWQIERSVELALDGLDPLIKDAIPDDIVRELEFTDVVTAFRNIHQPRNRADAEAAAHRFAYEEALVYQVILAQRRQDSEAMVATPRLVKKGGALEAFDVALPFTLTSGQVAVCEDIFKDIAQSHPMHRLVQGEVGSGKTVCALRAMLSVVDAGGQAVLLAPTEVLAQQHARSIAKMLGDIISDEGMFGDRKPYSTKIALLTGSLGAAARRQALLDIQSGMAGIVVGTHALLEEKVQFADLGLVVVDEQHRFGVEQRAVLMTKSAEGTRPHLLVMTATPIPRTVAMTVFGDLDVSTLSELPAGRSPIATHVVAVQEKPQFLERAWTRIQEEVAKGHQAYVVCPRITSNAAEEDSEIEDAPSMANVEDLFHQLSSGPLFGLKLAQLHGKLKADVKEDVMQTFARGEIDVVIATTVIEVGVDVPNASVMVIMDADRFGVSQLHQLRGRVGRGSVPGLCLLVTNSMADSPARERLDAVASTLDGFELARIDLEQRREGDVLGVNQSGRRSSLRILRVLRDEDLIAQARDHAVKIVAADTALRDHEQLKRRASQLVNEERSEYLEKA
jgi:ATP-dependent DNA helicase RecG